MAVDYDKYCPSNWKGHSSSRVEMVRRGNWMICPECGHEWRVGQEKLDASEASEYVGTL